MSKETYNSQHQSHGVFRPTTVSKETYYSVKRGLLQCQKRPITVSKETYYSVKRDLLKCQRRPITMSKETYYSVKGELLQCQKRPITVSKEIYYSVKRDLLHLNTLPRFLRPLTLQVRLREYRRRVCRLFQLNDVDCLTGEFEQRR